MSHDAAVDSDRLPVDPMTSTTDLTLKWTLFLPHTPIARLKLLLRDLSMKEAWSATATPSSLQLRARSKSRATCWLTFLLSIWTLFFLTEYEESDTYQASYSFCNGHRPHNA